MRGSVATGRDVRTDERDARAHTRAQCIRWQERRSRSGVATWLWQACGDAVGAPPARTLSLQIRITVPYLWTYTHAAGANSKGWGSIQGLRGSEATTIFGTPPESLVLG